jgi:hypothetical protein
MQITTRREKFLLLGGRFVLTYTDALGNMTTPENGCKKNSMSEILFPGTSQADIRRYFATRQSRILVSTHRG